MTFRLLAALVALGSVASLPLACGEAGAQTDPVVVTSPCGEAIDGLYETAGFPPNARCEWLPFDGRTTLRILHELGTAPRDVSIFLSFYADGRSSAPAAGDLARVYAADAEAVEIHNQTNEDFFVKVVLR